MRGRKPLPAVIKIARGNTGHRRIVPDTPAPPGAPDPPDLLDRGERAEWRRICAELASVQLLSRADRGALTAYCLAWGMASRARRSIRAHGTATRDPNTHRRLRNPAVTDLATALSTMRAYLTEFGLTPSSRCRVKLPATIIETGARNELEDVLG